MKYANILEHFPNSVNQKHNITESCMNKRCLEYENAGKRWVWWSMRLLPALPETEAGGSL